MNTLSSWSRKAETAPLENNSDVIGERVFSFLSQLLSILIKNKNNNKTLEALKPRHGAHLRRVEK